MRCHPIIIFAFILLSCGCALPRVTKNNRKVVLNEYPRDIMAVRDYVFCNYIVNSWGITLDEEFYMNQDSIFSIFMSSFSRLQIDAVYKEGGGNYCDNYFRKDW